MSNVGIYDSVLCHGTQIGALLRGISFLNQIFIVCDLIEITYLLGEFPHLSALLILNIYIRTMVFPRAFSSR